MANFFAELKRRHIYRVGAAYAVVAWAVAQGIDLLSQVFSLPSWIAQPVIIVLAVGFPIALLVTWVVESKPQEVIASAVRSKPTTVDWMLFSAVAVLIALSGYRLIAPSSDPAARQAGVDAARSAASSPAGAISIVVLPFANLSGDAQQEFFSDGITEEITSALARVPDLRVVARTSAYQFRDQNRDIQTIGQQLHATHFIEGSVRKDGNRLRITAQLIKAEDGTHMWTENYDRELTGVFAIQEDIATAIAGALRTPLGLKPGGRLIANRSIDPESYEQYLRAKAMVRARGAKPLADGAALLEQIVARDPDFAPAWALLALAYSLTPIYSPALRTDAVDELRRLADSYLPKAEVAARRAIQLDPDFADGYLSLANVQGARAKWIDAVELISKAASLDPTNTDILRDYGNILAEVGRLKEALDVYQRALALEPFAPAFKVNTATQLYLNGKNDAAIELLKALPPGNGVLLLTRIYAAMGRYSDAAATLTTVPSSNYPSGMLEAAVRLLRMAPASAVSPQTLPRLGNMEFVYLYIGAPDRVLEHYEAGLEAGYAGVHWLLWHSSYAPVWKTERFKAYARKAGLVEYWRAKGWPEFCRPMGSDDFVCE